MQWRLTQLQPLSPAPLTQILTNSPTALNCLSSPSISLLASKFTVTMRRRSLRAAAALVLVVQSLLLLVCQPADAQSAHGDHDHSHMLHEPQGQLSAS